VEIDLRHITRAARRWGWLILLVTLLAGVAAYAISSRQTPMYSATASILVNPNQATTQTDFTQIQASRGQAETYRMLIESGPVLDRVVKALDLPFGRSALGEKITTTTVRDTQIVQIEVKDASAERAAEIANTLAQQFVGYVEELTVSRLNANLDELTQQVASLESRRAEIDQELGALDPDSRDGAVQRQITDLQDERTRVTQTLADLDSSIRTLNRQIATTTAPVEVADPAEAPSSPYAPRTTFMALLGLFLGLLVAVGIVALLEFLDDTLRPEDDIRELTGAPVLAAVANLPRLAPGRGALYALSQPDSAATEALRVLQANLAFASEAEPIRTVAITSAAAGEGKSVVAANLGVVMAQAGLQTVIVDADLRSPRQHELFGVGNGAGLTSLLQRSGQPWSQVAVETDLPGLRVLPTGPLPGTIGGLLGSSRCAEVLGAIAQEVDIVLIDASPLLTVSDGLVTSARADATVLVARPGRTKRDQLGGAAQALWQAGARLVGVVLNRSRTTQLVSYERPSVSVIEDEGQAESPRPAPVR